MVTFQQKIIFLLVVVALLGFVNAQGIPPQTNINLEKGLQIYYPSIEYLKQNQDFTLNIRVGNITDGKLINNALANCTVEIQNSSGNVLFLQNLSTSSTLGGYNIFIAGGNFSNLEVLTWTLFCDNEVGGVAEGTVQVTITGKELTGEETSIMIFLLILYVCLLVLSIYSYGKLPSGNARGEDGMIIKISYLKYLRVFVGGLVYLFGFLILNLSGTMGIAYINQGFAGTLLFNLSIIMGYLAIPLLLLTLFKLLENALHDKEIKRLMARGIEVDGGTL